MFTEVELDGRLAVVIKTIHPHVYLRADITACIEIIPIGQEHVRVKYDDGTVQIALSGPSGFLTDQNESIVTKAIVG